MPSILVTCYAVFSGCLLFSERKWRRDLGKRKGELRGVEGGETVVCNENKAKGNKYYHTGKGEVSTFESVNFYPFLT